jgi:hypothetical protein
VELKSYTIFVRQKQLTMRQTIMQTYRELVQVKNPSIGLPIYFEYVSAYRRIVVVLDDSTWTIKCSFKGMAADLKPFEKTYGDKEVALAWAKAMAQNREVILSHTLTVREAKGKYCI